MAAATQTIEAIPVPIDRIFLSLNNPRHEIFGSEAKAIEHLCQEEDVYPLAKDIVKHGLNPLERFAVVQIEKRGGTHGAPSYYVAEGNRRICALKLLHDPDLAPATLRKSFEKLSEDWAPITVVSGVVFDSQESIKLWLDRIHSGPQGGIGRKEWNSEQKTRFYGDNKNKSAQALLDYAEEEKMISADERNGKLTTVQRFLSNDVFQEVIGFDQIDQEEAGRTRPKAEFDILVKRFIRDLVGKIDVNSRMNKERIKQYARSLASLSGVTSARIESEPLSLEPEKVKAKKERRSPPKKPEKAKHVQFESDIFSNLKGFGNWKLRSLYHSICSIDLDPHTPIVAIGAWSFFETLAACAGCNEGTSFDSFFRKAKLKSYGIVGETHSLKSALERIRGYGNTTKHHPVSATFNGEQLNNDMIALKDVILKCIEEAVRNGA